MAVTLANFNRISSGSRFKTIADVTFSGSYVATGTSEAVTAAALGMSHIDTLTIQPKGGYAFEYDYATGYVKVMQSASMTVYQTASPVTAQATSVKVGGAVQTPRFEGTNSPAADQTIQAGPLAEVPSGTNLSTITTRLEATGY